MATTKAEKAKAAAAKAKAAAAKAKAKAAAAKAAATVATAEAEAEAAEAESASAEAAAEAETAVAEEAKATVAATPKAPHEAQIDRYMGDAKVRKISEAQMNQLRFNMNAIQPLGQIIGRYKLHRGTVMDDFTISVIEGK